jgi:caffeoyl-CoA O-methyltransferase
VLRDLEERIRRDGVTTIPRSVARLLSTLVHCMQANRILEIGTAYGYATLWMALALPPAGKIWTIDPDIERTRVALEYFGRAGKAEQVEIINSPALDILPRFPQRNMDIVFVDAAGADSEAYLEQAVALLKLSGLLLFAGLRVAGEPHAECLEKFTRLFLNHRDLDATLIPLGDGTGIGARIR